MTDPISFFDLLTVYGGVAVAWVSGEGGRAAVVGGFGGLLRWANSERRRIRDGVVAVITGAAFGQYMWPVVLHVPLLIGRDPVAVIPETAAAAAFLAGTIGMSMVKIGLAWLETKFGKGGL